MKQANDIGHNHPPIPIDGNDLKVAKTAANQLPANFEFDAAEKAAKQHFAKYRETRRLSNEERRQATQAVFEIYAATAAKLELQERLKSRSIKKGIPLKKADLAIAVIRYYSGYEKPEPVNRYANVLREVALRNVPPTKLAEYLKEHGIDKLHKAYQERNKRAAAEMSEASEASDDSDDSDNRERTAAKRKSRELDGTKPSLETEDLIITWDRAKAGKFKPGTRLLVWIKIVDDNSGKVFGVFGRQRNGAKAKAHSILSNEVRRAS
jgi:hypothetical protein